MRMKVGFLAAVACAFMASGASAQDIPRIKARILSFDGKTLSVTSGTAGQSLAIGLIPSTRLMYEEKLDPAALKPGDYLGATLAKNGGAWEAREIHLLPQALQGAGEGLYPLPSAPEQRIATGAVGKSDGKNISVEFRGSVGSDGATCTGRAPRQGGCKGEVSFILGAKTPVVAIKQGDKSILVPGKVVAVSVVAGPNGHLVTPGLTVENETGGEVLDVAPAKPPQTQPPQAKPAK
ncbi:MAG: hypothetical protein V4527_09350 [Pseudomonadota bacterium]